MTCHIFTLICIFIVWKQCDALIDDYFVNATYFLESGGNSEIFKVEIEFSLTNSKVELIVVDNCEANKLSYELCRHLMNSVLEHQRDFFPASILQFHESFRNFEHQWSFRKLSDRTPQPNFIFNLKPVSSETINTMMAEIEPVAIRNIVSIVLRAQTLSSFSMKAGRAAFIHSCSFDYQHQEILIKLLDSLIKHKLIHSLQYVFVLNYGNTIPTELQQLYTTQFSQIHFIHVTEDVTYSEVPTLRIMHTVNQFLYGTANEWQQILYLHTKGVTYIQPCEVISDWVDLMLHFLVEKHETNYHLLASGEFDVIAPLLITSPKTLQTHFAGNFWWVNGAFLANELPVLDYISDYMYNKYAAENWLLDAVNDMPTQLLEIENHCGYVDPALGSTGDALVEHPDLSWDEMTETRRKYRRIGVRFKAPRIYCPFYPKHKSSVWYQYSERFPRHLYAEE